MESAGVVSMDEVIPGLKGHFDHTFQEGRPFTSRFRTVLTPNPVVIRLFPCLVGPFPAHNQIRPATAIREGRGDGFWTMTAAFTVSYPPARWPITI